MTNNSPRDILATHSPPETTKLFSGWYIRRLAAAQHSTKSLQSAVLFPPQTLFLSTQLSLPQAAMAVSVMARCGTGLGASFGGQRRVKASQPSSACRPPVSFVRITRPNKMSPAQAFYRGGNSCYGNSSFDEQAMKVSSGCWVAVQVYGQQINPLSRSCSCMPIYTLHGLTFDATAAWICAKSYQCACMGLQLPHGPASWLLPCAAAQQRSARLSELFKPPLTHIPHPSLFYCLPFFCLPTAHGV